MMQSLRCNLLLVVMTGDDQCGAVIKGGLYSLYINPPVWATGMHRLY